MAHPLKGGEGHTPGGGSGTSLEGRGVAHPLKGGTHFCRGEGQSRCCLLLLRCLCPRIVPYSKRVLNVRPGRTAGGAGAGGAPTHRPPPADHVKVACGCCTRSILVRRVMEGDREGEEQGDKEDDREGEEEGDKEGDGEGDGEGDEESDREGDREDDREGDRDMCVLK